MAGRPAVNQRVHGPALELKLKLKLELEEEWDVRACECAIKWWGHVLASRRLAHSAHPKHLASRQANGSSA